MTEVAQRRLAAIVSADVVGYSRLMGVDETGTHARLRSRFSTLIKPMIIAHNGRVVKLMGDGLLVEFPSAVDAVNWAVEAQKAVAGLETDRPVNQRIIYRIGVNLGDVIVDGADIFGDGVNVAARLQEMAEPGGICISNKVHKEVRGKLSVDFADGGNQTAKNIALPIQVWRWSPKSSVEAKPLVSSLDTSLSLPNNPSIAVLPFENLSSDPEQDFFADGIVEDLITALSRFPWLFVIARNSSFSYRGKKVPINQVANDLGVSYVVEGSVRSSKTRLRISVQLIEAITDRHVWADNFNRPIGDLFDLQDEVTQSITGVLIPALSGAERDRSLRDIRPNIDAWQAYQKGLAHFYRPYSEVNHAEARRLFDRSVELDQGFSDAHAMIALMGIYALDSGQSSYTATAAEILDEAERAARSAVETGDANALAHLVLGRVYGHKLDFESGIAECEIAVQLNPNLAIAHHELGFVLVFGGRYEEAISCFDRAIKLSPNDPTRWNFHLLKGIALYGMEKFEEAIVCFKEAARQRPMAFWPHINLTVCLSALNRMEEARIALAESLKLKPDLNLGFFRNHIEKFSDRPNHLRRLIGDLSKAGLPE